MKIPVTLNINNTPREIEIDANGHLAGGAAQ